MPLSRKQQKKLGATGKLKRFAVTRQFGAGDDKSFTTDFIKAHDFDSALEKAEERKFTGDVVGLVPTNAKKITRKLFSLNIKNKAI